MRHNGKKFVMNVFFFFVLLGHKRRIGEANIRGILEGIINLLFCS